MRPRLRIVASFLALGLAACGREPVTSTRIPVPPASNARLMEITITGIGTPNPSASVRAVGATPAAAAVQAMSGARTWPHEAMASRTLSTLPDTAATSHDGTIQLSGVSVESFTWGTRGNGGYRYIAATFKVRNASQFDSAYGDPRTNLTLMAVNASGSLSRTAIKTLRKFDGTPITSGLESQILPTGWARLSGNATLTTNSMDVLQVYTEAELLAATVPVGDTLQAYGFVVRNPSTAGSRTLPANPDSTQFAGLVTIAYKVPLQATAADDPFSITGLFLAMDDNQPFVTQSFEDTDATSVTALASRATSLTATVRSVVGTSVGALPAQFECAVRSAGSAGIPAAYLAQGVTVSSESPNPFSSAAFHIDSTTPLSATFPQKMKRASFSSFVVNGFMSGRQFLGGGYTISTPDSLTLTTPNPKFVGNEVVQVTLTSGLNGAASGVRACPGTVYQYRVAPVGGNAVFGADTASFAVGSQPRPIGVGDFNEDGKLDMVVGNYNNGLSGSTVTLLTGDGTGSFTAAGNFAVGNGPRGIVVGDFNGDGHLDFATANFDGNSITVRLGDGHGNFPTVTTLSGPHFPQAITAGDINGDGKLDLVSASTFNSLSILGEADVFLGDGTGGFTAAAGGPFTVGHWPYGVQLVDVNSDGILDLVTANQVSSDVTVLIGDGTGSFAPASGSPYAVGLDPSGLMVADIDGDGHPDLIIDNSGLNHPGTRGTVSVLLGNGTGGFSTMTGSPFSADTTTNGILWGMDVGDLNGDDKIDIVVAGRDDDKLTVMLNTGSGFTDTTIALPTGTAARWVNLAPLKADGKLAITVAAFGHDRVLVLPNH